MSVQNFNATHYGPRARDYLTSPTHASGADLDFMAQAVQSHPGGRVLDLGCGGGHVSYRASPFAAEVVAADVTPAMLALVAATAAERGYTNIVTREAAAEHLPFADAEFDIVLSRYSTHHWQDMAAGLREARRVLRRGGVAIFADTIAPADAVLDTHLQTIELLRDVSHVRNYTLAQWFSALGQAGFAARQLMTDRRRMAFEPWFKRAQAPESHRIAIRSLQEGAPDEVKRHFKIENDGSFYLDAMTVEGSVLF